jgi:peptidoglycan/LPS O-acetylase OafA/YrhL
MACLDGLRGIAALWVLIGHSMILSGLSLPVIGQPHLGVDLFILLSGFLMVLQYQLRRDFEDWNRLGTWAAFWTRRFFRIAPLFYAALLVALLLGPMIYSDRVAIDTFLDHKMQQPERFLDASVTNVLLHLTFVFGLLPSYAYRTPLPDWSLGLEMQFYAVFPVLMFLTRKIDWLWTTLLIVGASIAILVLTRHTGVHFPMPSFLPIKMPLFLCGMLIAADTRENRTRLWMQIGGAALLAAIPLDGHRDLLHLVVRELLVLVFVALVHFQHIWGIGFASKLLGSRPFHWLGELSFGVYLWHLLIVHVVAAWAIAKWGHSIGATDRFLIVLGIAASASYALAFVTYKAIEVPGQKVGKTIQKRVSGSDSKSRSVAAEEIAAP